ncbi:MAG TPA: hypothetical protein VMR45_04885 [Patescibacteria group bacterium]|nr:hypothetical protein [Patescibacteria group bacterium]
MLTSMLSVPKNDSSDQGFTGVRGLEADKEFVTCTISIEPGAAKRVALGSYYISQAEPQFVVTMTPDIQDHLGLSFERLDIPGKPKYVAFYLLHNFSEKFCQVTVARRV